MESAKCRMKQQDRWGGGCWGGGGGVGGCNRAYYEITGMTEGDFVSTGL